VRRTNEIIFAGLIAAGLALSTGYLIFWLYAQSFDIRPTIMIRKDSLERIIKQPCDIDTIEYIGNYILCKRRYDYESREQHYWPGPYPSRP